MRKAIAFLGLVFVVLQATAQEKPKFVGAERVLRNQLIAQIQEAWRASDFAFLERTAEEYASKRTRTLTGKWRLSVYEAALKSVFQIPFPEAHFDPTCKCKVPAVAYYGEADALWKAVESKADAWIAKYPASPHAINAKAALLIQRAWFYRGSGYADTVPREALPVFNEHLSRARALLESTKSFSRASPLWFENMLKLANFQAWPRKAFFELADDFVQNGHDYPDAYQAIFQALEPRWGGSFESMEALARVAMKRTSATEGAGLYARLYWNAYSGYGMVMFKETRADWPLMRKGFEDIIAQYPDNWNFNGYALFACVAEDLVTARVAFEKIGTELDELIWGNFPIGLCYQAAMRTK